MARTKIVEEKKIKTMEEADLTLKEISENEREIELIQFKMNEQIEEIKLNAKMQAEEYEKRNKELGKDLKAFCEDNRADLDGKSKKLNFGSLGFRLSTKLTISKNKEANIIEYLRKLNHENCINVKETVNKDELKKLSTEIIYKVGASLKTEDTFWYETFKEKLEG